MAMPPPSRRDVDIDVGRLAGALWRCMLPTRGGALRAPRSRLRHVEGEIAEEPVVIMIRALLESEAASAGQRAAALASQLDRLTTGAAEAGGEEVELRAREREAKAPRDLLGSARVRDREAVVGRAGDGPPVDARVLSEARVPGEPPFRRSRP